MTDYSEYPKDHIGRKKYVTVNVNGERKLVAACYAYMGYDARWYFQDDPSGHSNQSAYVMPDKLAYVSPLDGSYITSRSQHGEHMRRHGVIEVGNERVERKHTPMPRARHDIIEAMQGRGYER